MSRDEALSSPAALRNRLAIAEILSQWLPPTGLVLEVASGTGEHVSFFAARFPKLDWQPSDPDEKARASIRALSRATALPNLRPLLAVDCARDDWQVPKAAAILAINMVHISPWAATLGLIAGAARLLATGGPLILYGPWIEQGVTTAPSNLAFDDSLRERNPAWGLREVRHFTAEAAQTFVLAERRPMPANNLMLLYRRRG